jgi:hypothetical protein
VAGACSRVGDEIVGFGRSGIPENLGDIPGAICIVDQQAISKGLEFAEDAEKGIGGGALEKSTSLGIDRCGEEIVGLRVTDIEVNGGIESSEFDEVGFAKGTGLAGRRGGEGGGAELIEGFRRSDVVEVGRIGAGVGAKKRNFSKRNSESNHFSSFVLSSKKLTVDLPSHNESVCSFR